MTTGAMGLLHVTGEQRTEALEALERLARQDLRQRRYRLAHEALEVLTTLAPFNLNGWKMKIELAERQGKKAVADGLREIVACLE